MKTKEEETAKLLEQLHRKSVLHDFILDVFSEIITEQGIHTEQELVQRVTNKVNEVSEKVEKERESDGTVVTGEGGTT